MKVNLNSKPTCKKEQGISLLFANDLNLFDVFFDESKSHLKQPPEEILAEANYLTSSEKLLIELALDFWLEAKNARVFDLYKELDAIRFECCIMALEYFYQVKNMKCCCCNCFKHFQNK